MAAVLQTALPSEVPLILLDRVTRWLKEVPLYRDRENLQRPPVVSLEEFQRLHLITKREIREGFPHNFLRDGKELDELLDENLVELEHTSGTSEERTPLLLPKGWWSEQENRALQLNPIVATVLQHNGRARRVVITSPVCSGEIRYTGLPSCAERTVGDARFVSLSRLPFLWSEADLARMSAESAEWAPEFLDVDPVYGILFALYCERRGIRLPSLKFIVCTYEFVSLLHRRVLQRVFGVPVLDLYGSTETGHLLMEDGAGAMKSSAETAFLEVVNVDRQGIGDLVVTTLTNDYMPLIRYRIGDLVEVTETGTYNVHGRAIDAINFAGGSRVTTLQIDNCFEAIEGLAHYQLVRQKGRDGWLMRVVPDTGAPSSPDLQRLKNRLCEVLGTGEVEIQVVPILMPEKSGKFRLIYPGQ